MGWSDLITVPLNMISQASQNRWQSDQATLQNKRNMELSKYQWDLNKQMYNEANQYNSPSAQMARYKEAGLNPNLIYGQGTPGNAPNVMPQYKSPEFEANIRRPLNPSEALNNALTVASHWIDINNAKKQGEILDQEVVKRTAEAQSASEYWFHRIYNLIYANEGKKYKNILDFNMPLPMWGNEAMSNMIKGGIYYNRYQADMLKNNAQVALINSQRALSNATTGLRNKELENYLPPLTKSLLNVGSSIGGGLIRGGFGLFSKVAKLKGISSFTTKSRNTINTLKQMHY